MKQGNLQFSPESTLFTSDTHFYHKNIIKYTDRYSVWQNVEEMNAGLIDNWNKVVKPTDTVIHHGDFAFASKNKCLDVLSKLNGNIILIYGNHDRDKHSDVPLDAFYAHYQYLEYYVGNQAVVSFHYPIESWNGMHKGSWHFHGHCHASLSRDGGYRQDVGIDCHPERRPFMFRELSDIMGKKSYVAVDHHTEGSN